MAQGKAKILIVDDLVATRAHLGRLLRDNGYEVIEAENGGSGLHEMLDTDSLDLAIVDFNMPIYNGIEMLQKAKEVLGNFKFPVFMLTTESSKELKAQGKEAGLVAWIIKPFSEEKILYAVRTVLEKKPPQ
jgi:two-component system, chemotaxis family, chemotaxis protein CheY